MDASSFIKFETSPTVSDMSTPDAMFSPLLGAASPASTAPLDAMTPLELPELSRLSTIPEESADSQSADASEDKKPTKKRKSWGQPLPEPKTCLPPRKRAKTEDEKEQRRVERVLRNRRAAQSSRERKRQEVEALEKRNKELEARLQKMEQDNMALLTELSRVKRDTGLMQRSSSPNDVFRGGNITLTQQLFGSQEERRTSVASSSADSFMSELQLPAQANPTVNPASLSPELHPVEAPSPPASASTSIPKPITAAPAVTASNNSNATEKAAEKTATTANSDLTQRPAAMLCDLQCHLSEEAVPRVTSTSSPASSPLNWLLACLLPLMAMQTLASQIYSFCSRPMTQISTSLKAGTSIVPSPATLTTILWLLTHRWTSPSSSTTTTSDCSRQARRRISRGSPATTSSQYLTRQGTFSTFSTTLRTSLLQRLLTSSPTLARPIEVATMAALRLVSSEGRVSRAEERPWRVLCDELQRHGVGFGDTPTDLANRLPLFVEGDSKPPSREALLTLLFILRRRGKDAKRASQYGTTAFNLEARETAHPPVPLHLTTKTREPHQLA